MLFHVKGTFCLLAYGFNAEGMTNSKFKLIRTREEGWDGGWGGGVLQYVGCEYGTATNSRSPPMWRVYVGMSVVSFTVVVAGIDARGCPARGEKGDFSHQRCLE